MVFQSPNSHLKPFHELREMVHDGKIFMVEQCTNLYYDRVEVISNLVESFQMYSALITIQPELTGKHLAKQVEMASYYENIIRNIDVVLQMDQVHCTSEGLPHLPTPRHVPSRGELETVSSQIVLQSACNNAEKADKEAQRLQRSQNKEKDNKLNYSNFNDRIQSMDDLTDMGFSIPDYSSIPTVGDAVPQCPAGMGTNASAPTSTPRIEGGPHVHKSDPSHNRSKTQIIDSFTGISDPLKSKQRDKESSKGGKKKTSQGAQIKTQPQPSTSSHPSPRNTSTGRP